MAFEFKLPDIGEGIVEGEIVRWLVDEGDAVDVDQPIVEILTDKATVEIPSPLKGRIAKKMGMDGDIIEVGSTLLVIDKVEGEISPRLRASLVESDTPAPRAASAGRNEEKREILTTPAVRRLAQQLGVDLAAVSGTGPGERVTREDVERHLESPELKSGPQYSERPVETVPYRGLRRRIGDRLSEAERTAVHFTYIEEADATNLVRLRREIYQSAADGKVRVTYLPFFIKAAVAGLIEYPLLNASLDQDQGVVVLKKFYDIGVAAHTPEGLMVPVVREADMKSLMEISQEISRLSEAASKGTIAPEDLRHSTFTITSLGSLGGIAATPIVNYPEVAILAVHKIVPRPVVREGQIVIRDMVNLSLSLDHRVVDGTVAAQFLHHVIALIEAPDQLLEASGPGSAT